MRVFLICLFLSVLGIFASIHPSKELPEFHKNIETTEPDNLSKHSTMNTTQVPIPKDVLVQYGLPYGTTGFKADPAFPSLKKLQKRANICHTNTDSPLASDVQFLIEYLDEDRWNWYCHESYERIPYCTRLVSYGTAAIGVCGIYRHRMLCQGIGKAVSAVFEDCWRKINDDVRVGGMAITWGVPRGIQGFRGLIIYHT